MMNYTNRVMTALESAMGHEIAWPDRQERAVNSAHFTELGVLGCIGLTGTPLHFDMYTEDDDVNYIRWKWISKKEAHRVLRWIDARLLKRSGLHDALWMDWARLEEEVRMWFSYIDNL
ncbi:hypothetical protein R1sor_017269 [Riccia sorocarpa]|uniref:Uncharacterized protein n=1 Tax=Riccia sorocarpa TaxID=122646 RepID=A0ABD3I946_9MARC